MREKKDQFYDSSSQSFWKLIVIFATLLISIVASVFDAPSCYVTVIVQGINNIYDFAPFIENKKYSKKIKNESIGAIIAAVLAIIASIAGLFGKYAFMNTIIARLICIFLVALPLLFIYNDYKLNIKKEDKGE